MRVWVPHIQSPKNPEAPSQHPPPRNMGRDRGIHYWVQFCPFLGQGSLSDKDPPSLPAPVLTHMGEYLGLLLQIPKSKRPFPKPQTPRSE